MNLKKKSIQPHVLLTWAFCIPICRCSVALRSFEGRQTGLKGHTKDGLSGQSVQPEIFHPKLLDEKLPSGKTMVI